MAAIRGFGAYLPRYRIGRTAIADQHGDHARGGETAVPAHDEDVVTMAVEAAETGLGNAGIDGDGLDAVYAASVSDPFDERGIAPHVAVAVGAPDDVRVADFAGSARAATTAVLAARDAVRAGSADVVLVVATDILRADPGSAAERTAGAGAGALVLGPDGDVATLEAAAAATTGFVGRFVPAGGSPVPGDARFNRERYVEAVAAAVGRLDAGPPTHAALPAPDGRWAGRALGAADLSPDVHSTFDDVAYAGAGGVLLDAALALERAGTDETLLLVGYGPGGADALAFATGDGTERLPDPTVAELLADREPVTYAKHRDYRDRAWGVA